MRIFSLIFRFTVIVVVFPPLVTAGYLMGVFVVMARAIRRGLRYLKQGNRPSAIFWGL